MNKHSISGCPAHTVTAQPFNCSLCTTIVWMHSFFSCHGQDMHTHTRAHKCFVTFSFTTAHSKDLFKVHVLLFQYAWRDCLYRSFFALTINQVEAGKIQLFELLLPTCTCLLPTCTQIHLLSRQEKTSWATSAAVECNSKELRSKILLELLCSRMWIKTCHVVGSALV